MLASPSRHHCCMFERGVCQLSPTRCQEAEGKDEAGWPQKKKCLMYGSDVGNERNPNASESVRASRLQDQPDSYRGPLYDCLLKTFACM